MTEVRHGPTPRVRFREVSVKRELTVHNVISVQYIYHLGHCALCVHVERVDIVGRYKVNLFSKLILIIWRNGWCYRH